MAAEDLTQFMKGIDMRSFFSGIALAGVLSFGSALASPIDCPVGRPSGARTGFFFPNPADPLHGCPTFVAACVDMEKCIRPVPAHCPEGTHFMTLTKDFVPALSDSRLSCPVEDGACVSDTMCPQYSPIRCEDGDVQTQVVGFYSIGNGISCPNIQMACVRWDLCPQY